ncbi:hypothetical protein NDU88_004515 [Pleurodeles waltl]|uniref:Uncharacterized protein n=1 Tax=Pleurodeles waltl TaxID=8319 RepID=A0AAV7LK86_PLEWA|nr:hypothetical protein NDU88_004515 [Pleurodeles waltl]
MTVRDCASRGPVGLPEAHSGRIRVSAVSSPALHQIPFGNALAAPRRVWGAPLYLSWARRPGPVLPRKPPGVGTLRWDRHRAVCRARASVTLSSQLLRGWAPASAAARAASQRCFRFTPDSRHG